MNNNKCCDSYQPHRDSAHLTCCRTVFWKPQTTGLTTRHHLVYVGRVHQAWKSQAIVSQIGSPLFLATAISELVLGLGRHGSPVQRSCGEPRNQLSGYGNSGELGTIRGAASARLIVAYYMVGRATSTGFQMLQRKGDHDLKLRTTCVML